MSNWGRGQADSESFSSLDSFPDGLSCRRQGCAPGGARQAGCTFAGAGGGSAAGPAKAASPPWTVRLQQSRAHDAAWSADSTLADAVLQDWDNRAHEGVETRYTAEHWTRSAEGALPASFLESLSLRNCHVISRLGAAWEAPVIATPGQRDESAHPSRRQPPACPQRALLKEPSC